MSEPAAYLIGFIPFGGDAKHNIDFDFWTARFLLVCASTMQSALDFYLKKNRDFLHGEAIENVKCYGFLFTSTDAEENKLLFKGGRNYCKPPFTVEEYKNIFDTCRRSSIGYMNLGFWKSGYEYRMR